MKLRIQVTEFSCGNPLEEFQANIFRDVLIGAFAEENMDGFTLWGFWDGSNFQEFSPMYDTAWNKKPGAEVYEDLVYNKWWTRNAKATTDASGLAFVKGFYGDYDVTVSANGKTKTVSCAYHKGYDNCLEIILD